MRFNNQDVFTAFSTVLSNDYVNTDVIWLSTLFSLVSLFISSLIEASSTCTGTPAHAAWTSIWSLFDSVMGAASRFTWLSTYTTPINGWKDVFAVADIGH